MEIKEALVEIDKLKARCAELETEATAGKAYRSHLMAEISRLAAATKNDAMAPVLLAMAETTPIPALENVVKGLNASFDAMFPPKGAGQLRWFASPRLLRCKS